MSRITDDLISLLQGAQGNHAAMSDKSAIPGPTVPGLEAAKRLGLPPPPEALKEALAQMGNGPLMMMMSMMSGVAGGPRASEAEAQARRTPRLCTDLAASTPRKTERDQTRTRPSRRRPVTFRMTYGRRPMLVKQRLDNRVASSYLRRSASWPTTLGRDGPFRTTGGTLPVSLPGVQQAPGNAFYGSAARRVHEVDLSRQLPGLVDERSLFWVPAL